MFLLDTNVLSELSKERPERRVVTWLSCRVSSEVFISAITLGEIELGIAQVRSTRPEFADKLSTWLEALIVDYGDRILPVDAPIARRWGILTHLLGHGNADVLIAATALEHGLTIATRNVRHFERTATTTFNPFAA